MSSSDSREYVFSPRALPISLYYNHQLSSNLDENNRQLSSNLDENNRQLSSNLDDRKTNAKPKPEPKNSLEITQSAPKKNHNCCVIL